MDNAEEFAPFSIITIPVTLALDLSVPLHSVHRDRQLYLATSL